MNKKILILILSLIVVFGCSDPALNRARQYQKESDKYYKKSEQLYKKIVKRSRKKEPAYELGKLYLENGKFSNAVEVLKNSKHESAIRLLAIAYYKLGDYTAALDAFAKNQSNNDEIFYYYAMTCEKLNLFDQAIELYKKIKDKSYLELAKNRLVEIERKSKPLHIREISPEVDKIIANSPGLKEYPQASIIYLLSDEKTQITKDNKEISWMHYLIKVLNDRGKDNASEATIEYDSTFEKIEVEYARTIKPDGSVVDVGSKHIRDVSKYLNFPLYSNVRICIISFPEIAAGSVIEYKIKLIGNRLINKNNFISVYPVQNSEPVLDARYNLIIPKEMIVNFKNSNLEYNTFGANLEAYQKEENDNKIYTWTFKNIPQIIPENKMPPYSLINTMIIMSTFKSWQDIYDWWWKLAKDKIVIDADIKDKVIQLTKDLKEPKDKIRAIHNFCAKDIRYVAVEYGQAGYEPHSAVDIFKNKYGDCKDQAILLVAMLRELGFSAWPVLIATREHINMDNNFPSVMFNHCIASVYFEGKTIFMDPTSPTCSFEDLPFDDQGRNVLIIKEDGYSIETTPIFLAQHNLAKQNLNIEINVDGNMKANRLVKSFGIYDQAQRYWLLYTMPDMIKDYIQSKIQSISIGSRLINYDMRNLEDLNKPVELEYNFEGVEYFTVAGNLRIMPQLTEVDTSIVSKEKRVYPLDLGVQDLRETITVIKYPEDLVVKYLPDSINIDNNWIKFNCNYENKSNNIYLTQRIELKNNFVNQAEYADFKAFWEKLAKQVKQRVVLEKKK